MSEVEPPRTSTHRDPVRALALAFVAVLTVVWGGYNLGRALLGPKQGLDFAQHYIAGRALLAGVPDVVFPSSTRYRAFADSIDVPRLQRGRSGRMSHVTHGYPPFPIVLFAPFSLPPFGVARIVFYVASLAALVASLALLFANRPEPPRRSLRLVGLGAALLLFPTAYALYMGQSTFVLLLLLVGALAAGRRDAQVLAGLLVAIAGLVKFFPFLFAVWFAIRGQWRAFFACGVFAGLLTLATLPLVGLDVYVTYFLEVLPDQMNLGVHPRNHGFPGFFARLLTENGSVRPLADAPALAQTLTSVCVALTLGGVSALAFRGRHDRGRDYELGFALFIVAALLVVGHFLEHQAPMLLPAWLLILERAREQRPEVGPVVVVGVLASFVVWAFVLTTGEDIAALPTATLAQPLHSLKFLATLTLLAAGGAVMWRSTAAPPEART